MEMTKAMATSGHKEGHSPCLRREVLRDRRPGAEAARAGPRWAERSPLARDSSLLQASRKGEFTFDLKCAEGQALHSFWPSGMY